MNRVILLVGSLLFTLSICFLLQADALSDNQAIFPTNHDMQDHLGNWLNRIGRFHLLFLHFPIALITMTVVAEWLWIWFRNSIFNHAARFMILAAAVFAPPTALLGLAFGYGQPYEGLSLEFYIWHRYFGLLTAGLAVIAAILRERCVRHPNVSAISYYLCLFLLFICVSLTGAFGGGLAFGLDVW
jgi:uncharacterized membrane protein